MGKRYLIDTNILIYFLGNKIPKKNLKVVRNIIKESFNISIITKIEMLSYSKLSKKDDSLIRKFLSNAMIYPLTDDIVETTIKLRKKYNIKIPDSILAATAIVNDLGIVTRNVSDFQKIKKIKIYNPYA